MNDQAIEQEIKAKGLIAARVTLAQIDALMARVTYIGGRVGETTSTVVHAFLDGTFLLASGHSACVSVENFDAELGIKMATRQAETKARDQLWLLEGYALRTRLAGPTDEQVSRFLTWRLPRDFAPDGGVQFTPPRPDQDPAVHWPSGTNLLTAPQAKAMLQHVLGG